MFLKKIKKLIKLFGYELINLKENKPHTTFEIIYHLLDKILKDKKTFTMIDVGSHETAVFSNEIEKNYLLKKKGNITSEFYLFEPNKHLLDKLKKTNKNKKIYNYGLGNIKEEKVFFIHEKSVRSSFLKVPQDYFEKRKQEGTPLYQISEDKVKIETLDNFCFNKNIEYIDFLKIDTQGYNSKVIEGAKDLIAKNKIGLIYTEINISKKYEVSESFYDFEKFLKNDYLLYGIDIGSRMTNVISRRQELISQLNIFYINKEFIKS